jgi:hypothetical protein
MSVLQVANLHFNSVGSERIELIAGNVKVFTAGSFQVNDSKVVSESTIGNIVGTSTISEKTDNYTLTINDVGLIISMNATTNKTVTIPANSSVAFPIGTRIDLMRYGTGNVNVAITTDTLSSTGAAINLKSQYSVASLIKVKNTQWILAGDIGSI